MSILRMPPLTPSLPQIHNLSSIGALTSTNSLRLVPPILRTITPFRPTTTIIRMGGGPRTFPGGVSKWQWKRMQAKKQKQLLKARLCRERQIYEMRKRAELRAAVSELERPWEVVERAPTLFSVSADEQLKTLADRFHRPGGFDLWSDRDGPQLFLGGGEGGEGIPSARFLSKGAVHSVKPYGFRREEDSSDGELLRNGRRRPRKKGLDVQGSGGVDGGNRDAVGGLSYHLRISSGGDEKGGKQDGKELSLRKEFIPQSSSGIDNRNAKYEDVMDGLNDMRISNGRVEREVEHNCKGSLQGRSGKKGTRQNMKLRNSNALDSKHVLLSDTEKKQRRKSGNSRSQRKPNVYPRRQVHDMSLKQDGSYELQTDQHKNLLFGGESEDDFELDLTSWRKTEN